LTPPEAPHLRTGRQAEKLAREHMIAAGLRCLGANYRCKLGELDLIMDDGSTLIIVEVRYRAAAGFVTAAETIDRIKCRKIARATRHFLQRHRAYAERPVRFDVVALSGSLQKPHIDWIRNAFSGDDLTS
jgi:putative endonuclease